MVNMKELNLNNNVEITDEGIKNMFNMTKL